MSVGLLLTWASAHGRDVGPSPHRDSGHSAPTDRTVRGLVLSADSHMLLELDELGEQVSFITLLGGFNGLKNTIPRAEGVAIDEHGTLYMVSEPNLFYRFEKVAK